MFGMKSLFSLSLPGEILLANDEIVIQSHITMVPPAKLPSCVVSKQKLSVISWNIDAFSNARVCSDFLASDTEDNASFSDVNFMTMVLLSNKCFASNPDPQLGGKEIEKRGKLMLKNVFCMKLLSRYTIRVTRAE